jgi:hypothetical protein
MGGTVTKQEQQIFAHEGLGFFYRNSSAKPKHARLKGQTQCVA